MRSLQTSRIHPFRPRRHHLAGRSVALSLSLPSCQHICTFIYSSTFAHPFISGLIGIILLLASAGCSTHSYPTTFTNMPKGRKSFPCPRAKSVGCKKKFSSRRYAITHAQRVHDNIAWPCPRAEELDCDKTFGSKSDAKEHAKRKHDQIKLPCPLAEEEGCALQFCNKQSAKKHAENIHGDQGTRPKFPCPQAEAANCKKKFASISSANKHARQVHDQVKWPCPMAEETGCRMEFSAKAAAIVHAERVHGPKRELKGFPCPRADEVNCKRRFTTKQNANRHADQAHKNIKWPCPSAEEVGCTLQFTDQHNAKRHAKSAHGDNNKPTRKEFPCPRAQDEKCVKLFSSPHNARTHSKMAHGKAESDETFIAAWPMISPPSPLRDVDGNIIPGWDKLPNPFFLEDRRTWACPHPGCTTTYLTNVGVKYHYLAIHLNARWPCASAKTLGCNRMFSSIYEAKKHADEHFPRCKWICTYDRCLAQMQGRKMSRVTALTHYNAHLRRGQFQKGEYKLEKVRNSE